MDDQSADREKLLAFELALDARYPESNVIPTVVLGYGEISSVLQIGVDETEAKAYKRMPMFESDAEVEAYLQLHKEYLRILEDEIDVSVPNDDVVYFWDYRGKWMTVYIIQEKLETGAIGSNLVHQLGEADVKRLFAQVMDKIQQVFAFNRANKDQVEIGFDGQISNWAVANMVSQTTLPDTIRLLYFDTNTPLLRRHGVEQLNTELFLRSAPSFMRRIVRAFFLEDVSTRYYDVRKVSIDLLANLYKEQRADLVPDLLEMVNTKLSNELGFEPISLKDVVSYYRGDAFIWRFYLALRKLDRALHETRGKPYPFILPDKIQR